MSMTLRNTKGSPLTHSETDANFLHCAPTSGTTQQNLDLKGSLDANNTWTKGQRGAFVALTSTTNSIAVNLNLSNNFSHTLTEDTTLAAPTNAVAGQSGLFVFTNHASSPKTLALNAFWKMPGGAPASILTDGNSAVDILSYVVAPGGTYAICSVGNDIS